MDHGAHDCLVVEGVSKCKEDGIGCKLICGRNVWMKWFSWLLDVLAECESLAVVRTQSAERSKGARVVHDLGGIDGICGAMDNSVQGNGK